MLSFFRKKNNPQHPDYSIIGTDMHSHLVPGIDDGSPDLETSLLLIKGLTDLGFRKLITTPHIYAELYPNTPDTILPGYNKVKTALSQENIRIDFHTAAEYLLDEQFDQGLEAGRPLLTLKDRIVLVELSFVVPAINLKELLFNLQIKGYQPVLAHPERYLYFGANKTWYDQLREAGCLFQLNLLSLNGYYGKGSLELADYLIKKKYIDLVGTDLHHERHLDILRASSQIMNTVSRLLDTGQLLNPSF